MTTVTMIAPAGFSGVISMGRSTPPSSSSVYTPDVNGLITADVRDVSALLAAGFRLFSIVTAKALICSPLPADLISIKAAATPANGAITIAAQPAHARKLQVRIVLGTPGTTDITAGTLTLVGLDVDGNAITEVVSLVTGATVTRKTVNAFASLTSGTVAAYAASGSGTGNTLGLGVSNDFAVPTSPGQVVGLACTKATKVTKVLGTSNVAADDVASTATVDTAACTIAPTTAPAANGLVDYELNYTYGIAA